MATQEDEISNYMLRLSGTGRTVGMAEHNIVALGAAMSSLGIRAEAGGSAMSKVMQKMNNAVMDGGEDLENFAKVSGVSAQEFSELWKNDPYQALLIFEKGIKGVIDSGGNAKTTLEELGIRELRETDAVLRLANGYDVMADAQGYANDGWSKGTALSDEATERYKTLGSQIQLFKNQLFATGRAIGEALAPYLQKLMDMLTPLLKKIEESSDKTKVLIATISGIVLALGPVLFTASLFVGVLHQASLALGIFSTSAKSGGLALKLMDGFTKLSTIGFKDFGKLMLGIAKSPLKLLVRGVGLLRVGLSILLGPIGLTITALTLITKGLVKAYKEVDWFREGVNALMTILKEGLIATFESLGKAISKVKDIVKDATGVFKDNMKSWYDSLPEDDLLVKGFEGMKNAFKSMNDVVKQSSKPMDVLEGNISKNTKKMLGSYSKLTTEASRKMSELRHGVLSEEDKMTIDQYNYYNDRKLEIPKKVQEQHDEVIKKYKGHASSLKETYDKMKEESLTKMKEKHKSEKDELAQFLKDAEVFSDEDQKVTLNKLDLKHEQSKKKTEEYHKLINEIYDTAMKERGYLTDEELNKIESLEQQAVDNTVAVLSEGEEEQRIIMERIANNKVAVNREAVEKLVKDSEEARDKTIQNAEEQRDGLIENAIKQAEAGHITEKQKDLAIEHAEEQYNEVVKKAEDTHRDVIKEASEQAEQHGIAIDEETGHVLSAWDRMKEKVIDKAKEMWNGFIDSAKEVWQEFYEWADWIDEKAYSITDSISGFFKGLWESVTEWFGKIKESSSEKLTETGEVMSEKWQEIKESTVQWFVDMKEAIVGKLQEIGEAIGGFFGALWEYIGPPLEAIWNAISHMFKVQLYILEFIIRGAFFVVKEIIMMVVNFVVESFTGMWDNVTRLVRWIYEGVRDYFTNMYHKVMAVVGPMAVWLHEKWIQIKNWVVETVHSLYSAVISWFNRMRDWIKSIVNTISITVSYYFSQMKSKVMSIVSPWITWIINTFNNMKSRVSNTTTILRNVLVQIWTSIKNRVETIVNGFRDRISSIFNNLKSRLSRNVEDTKRNVSSGFQWIRDKVEPIVNGMKNAVTGTFDAMKTGISNRIDDIKGFVDDMVKGVKSGLNSLIDGINWVGEKLNMSTTIPRLHTGTTHTTDYVTNGKINQGTMAVVGDKGRGNGPGGFRHEMIEDEKGNMMLTPGKDTIVPLRKGYKVHNGKTTYDYFKNNFGVVPKFSQGTSKNGGGGLIKKGLGWITDKIGDVMDYIKSPGKLLNKVIEQLGFDGFKNLGGIPGDMMRSGYAMLKDAIINQFKKWFAESAKGDGKYIDLGKGINFPFSPGGHAPGYPFAGPHMGVDLNYVYDKLYSVLGGLATARTGWNGGFGKMVDIVQGATKIIYGHMSEHAFRGSKQVKPGDYLGISGNTGKSSGPHLHFEVQKNGTPIDPIKWLKDNSGNNKSVKGGASKKLHGGGADHSHDADYDELVEQIKRSPIQINPSEFKKYAFKDMNDYGDPEDKMMAIINKTLDKLNLANLPKYANGGLIRRHQIAEVGEGNKPEMIIPLTRKSRAGQLIDLAKRLVGIDDDGNIEIENNNNFNQFAIDYSERLDNIENMLGQLTMALTGLAQQGIRIDIDGREVARATYKLTDRFIQSDKERKGRFRKRSDKL